MAVVINIGDVLLARAHFEDANKVNAFNIFHYRLREVQNQAGDPVLFAGEDMAYVGPEFADKWFQAFQLDWTAGGSATVKLLGSSAQKVYPNPKSASYHYTPGGNVFGEQMSDPLPLQDTVTILRRTGIGARWGMGRLYYVGLSEALQMAGVLTAGGVAAVQPLVNFCKEERTIEVNNLVYKFEPVLHSAVKDKPVRTNLITQTALSNTTIKTQRRRRPGKGI